MEGSDGRMLKHLLFFIALGSYLLFAASCATPQTADKVTVSPSPSGAQPVKLGPNTGTFFAINEVGLGPNGFVALTNFTEVPVSLEGLFLCQGSDCFQLPEAVVEAGQTARIAVGDGSGLEGVMATGATLGELRPSDGEIALAASKKIDDPGQMYNYLQWGSTPHQLTAMALKAGLWVENGYAPTSAKATRLFKVPETGLWLFDE
jgi:hypothetical protein